MQDEELTRTQKLWAEKGLGVLRELLPLMSPVGQYQDWTQDEANTLGGLLAASARSSESVLLLCAYGQLWDAEVIARSVVEGSLKFAYLLQRKAHFKVRFKQYSGDLFEIGILKDHHKAVDFLQTIPDPDAEEWKPIRDITICATEEARIREQYSSAERRTLETQWSFTGLLKALSSADGGFRELRSLAHGYAVASHIQHADYTGTSIALDRDSRSTERRNAIHLAHLHKMISVILACQMVRLIAGYRFIGKDLSPLWIASNKIEELKKSFGTPYEDWMRIEYGTSAPGD